MIWLAILLLAGAALAPLAMVLRRKSGSRGGAGSQGERDPAIALHRDQLSELDRDLAEQRILPAEHATARLEVQRRLLHVAATNEVAATPGSRTPVLVALALAPVLAIGLYFVGGSPGLPTAASGAAAQVRAAEEAMLIGQLRERLATMDPRTEEARKGFLLLGNVEDSRGNPAAAAAAWRQALQVRFDATLAARTAEATTQAEGHVSESSASLFRRALAAAPPNAPWRTVVEQRLAERRGP